MEKPTIKYLNSSEYNKKTKQGYCKECLELSIFRHTRFNQKNVIMCVRCLSRVHFKKKHYPPDGVLMFNNINFNLRLLRFLYRIKLFLFGDWKHKPFNKNFIRWVD